jgi:phage terminase large subunit-like protein
MTALAQLWIDPKGRVYVKLRHWIPRNTALKYLERDPSWDYLTWNTHKHVTLLDEPTISPKVQRRIGRLIAKISKHHNVKALAYDRYRASLVVSTVEATTKVPCIPISQTTTGLGPACQEFERRLKDGTIIIHPNLCFRRQCDAVELTTDTNGGCRPVKEGSTGINRGSRTNKIDGISALINGMTQVLREQMGRNKPKQWSGKVFTA